MLYFITGSKNKFEELRLIFPDITQINIDLPEIQNLDSRVIIKEKLMSALQRVDVTDGDIIVEDTSLYFDCLPGLPGSLIKWFLKSLGDKGLFELAEKYGNTNAVAKTVIGYTPINKSDIHFFEGEIRGTLVAPVSSSQGASFGWDTIFIPTGSDLRFSEMTREQKVEVSMRSIATRKLKDHLDKIKQI